MSTAAAIKMTSFLTAVKVSADFKTIVVTHTMKDDEQSKRGYVNYAFVHTLDIVAAGKFAEALANAIALIHDHHNEQLPVKVLNIKDGRSHA